MITFNELSSPPIQLNLKHKIWLKAIIRREGLVPGDINYLFCNDEYLLPNNRHFLNHDTLTDIITFDNCVGNVVSGDIMISVERTADNAKDFKLSDETEFLRVMAHGVLHLCGYKDKSDADAQIMRQKENEALLLYGETNNL